MFLYKIKVKLYILIHNFFSYFNLQFYYTKKLSIPKNLDIKLIIDVGVAQGTNFLLDNYPKAKYILIEPYSKFWPFIENNLLKKVNGKLFKIGADIKKGRKKFFLLDVSSSLIKRKNMPKHSYRFINVDKLENIINFDINKKCLLKIDTEGNELNVLKGAKKILKKINYLILEIRMDQIKTYNPSELISFCNKYGFIWKQIIDISYSKTGVNYLDVLFERKK
jgi:FkbM family methyltransferase